MASLIIAGRTLGRKPKPLFADFSIPFPPDLADGEPLTLRELLTRIVQAEVDAFHTRQAERRLAQVLAPAQIAAAAERGKIAPGLQEHSHTVDPSAAISTALQAFEDGLYLVIIDSTEYRSLDAPVYLQPDSRITFIRLVFLAGA